MAFKKIFKRSQLDGWRGGDGYSEKFHMNIHGVNSVKIVRGKNFSLVFFSSLRA